MWSSKHCQNIKSNWNRSAGITKIKLFIYDIDQYSYVTGW